MASACQKMRAQDYVGNTFVVVDTNTDVEYWEKKLADGEIKHICYDPKQQAGGPLRGVLTFKTTKRGMVRHLADRPTAVLTHAKAPPRFKLSKKTKQDSIASSAAPTPSTAAPTPSTHRHSLPACNRKYDFQWLLGQGTYGSVWSAVDRDSGAPMAIKAANGAATGRRTATKDLANEYFMQSKVPHPNVVCVWGLYLAELPVWLP